MLGGGGGGVCTPSVPSAILGHPANQSEKRRSSVWKYRSSIANNTPGDKKHEPSKMNYYLFHDELTPLGINSLYSS
jgi:hypothetical protein